MSSSMNPPDPYGTGDDRSSSGSNPPDGSTPPAYGSQPPAYGSTPPPYGSDQPVYGSDQPAYGSTPGAYGSTPPPAYGGYGSPQGYGQPAYGYPKNSLGVWSLVLGLVGIFVCGLFTGIPAIVVGNKAKAAVAEGQANNGGMATAGIVLGWVSTVLSLIGVIIFVALVATGAMAGLESTSTTSF